MSSNHGTVNVDELGQAAYCGKLAVVVDALISNSQLAHVADTVCNFALILYISILYLALQLIASNILVQDRLAHEIHCI